jgi:hypothetical protein
LSSQPADIFNALERDQDPMEKGWMEDDLMHANETGGSV